jgi:predicted glycosyltransferase
MRTRRGDGRILIYSHDTFGLGHLRRCRTIAHSLVERFKQLSVLILSGSPIIGSFDFKARVDFVRVPGVVKLRNGEYTPLNLHLDIRETMAMRASIIQHTAEAFGPDMFIVDKEPVGLRGELTQTLKMLKRDGTRLVLGLRDVMDEPRLLEPEWQRKKAMPALRDLYDEIWVYRSAIRSKASRCRRACARRWSTPATCIARCRRTARRRACRRSPTSLSSSSRPAAAATARA